MICVLLILVCVRRLKAVFSERCIFSSCFGWILVQGQRRCWEKLSTHCRCDSPFHCDRIVTEKSNTTNYELNTYKFNSNTFKFD